MFILSYIATCVCKENSGFEIDIVVRKRNNCAYSSSYHESAIGIPSPFDFFAKSHCPVKKLFFYYFTTKRNNRYSQDILTVLVCPTAEACHTAPLTGSCWSKGDYACQI
jgi:hypothetical protein